MKTLKLQLKTEEQRSSVNKVSLITAVFFAGIAGYAYFAFLPLFFLVYWQIFGAQKDVEYMYSPDNNI